MVLGGLVIKAWGSGGWWVCGSSGRRSIQNTTRRVTGNYLFSGAKWTAVSVIVQQFILCG